MITQHISKTERLIDKVASKEELELKRSKIFEVYQLLDSHFAQINQLKYIIPIIVEEIPLESRAKLKSRVKMLDELITETKESFSENKIEQKDKLVGIDRSLDELEDYCKDGWKYYRNRKLPKKGLLRIIEAIPGVERDIQGLRREYEQLEKTEMLINGEAIKKFISDANNINKRFNKILGGLSEEVKIFLRKVIGNESTLGDVNDEVLAWVRISNERLQHFKIRLEGKYNDRLY